MIDILGDSEQGIGLEHPLIPPPGIQIEDGGEQGAENVGTIHLPH